MMRHLPQSTPVELQSTSTSEEPASTAPQDKKPRKRLLKCTHCGNGAGRFEQWWNHDTGYGACRPCIDWVAGLNGGLSTEEIHSRYGIEGRHYQKTSGATGDLQELSSTQCP